ncbi:hypothetical protein KIPB_005669 [Kipferlia bialata]|uniref:Uncharacterized protein n=1 Tax=Kipferlia bialata TaxID=797122 RepID=A0A391NRK2_9EUKA|nr:hypothetical protein KIPB_005669 [Kipferlia bialata]|eukprot:g5669.t1
MSEERLTPERMDELKDKMLAILSQMGMSEDEIAKLSRGPDPETMREQEREAVRAAQDDAKDQGGPRGCGICAQWDTWGVGSQGLLTSAPRPRAEECVHIMVPHHGARQHRGGVWVWLQEGGDCPDWTR